MENFVDLSGFSCPEHFKRFKQLLAGLGQGQTVAVMAPADFTDDFSDFARFMGFQSQVRDGIVTVSRPTARQ